MSWGMALQPWFPFLAPEGSLDTGVSNLVRWMGGDVHVNVLFVERLPRGRGGKVRAVVSEVAG